MGIASLRLTTLAAAMLFWVGNASAGNYQITDLGGANGALAYGINNAGQVVGVSLLDFIPKATLWNAAIPSNVGPGAFVAYGVAVNNAGVTAGNVLAYSGDYAYSAAYAGNSSLYSQDGTESSAYAINNLGAVVGYAKADAVNGEAKFAMFNPNHATLWNGATAVDINPQGAYNSYAYAINDAGTIAGQVDGYAAVWNAGNVTYLGAGSAYAINAAGLIAGASGDDAVIWNGTLQTTLGIGSAAAINARGQVVGVSDGHATLWSHGQVDLNDYLDASLKNAGWVLFEATGINDAGLITANAYNANLGTYDAFVLSAVPEPGTWAMLMAGLGLIGVARCRRRHAAAQV